MIREPKEATAFFWLLANQTGESKVRTKDVGLLEEIKQERKPLPWQEMNREAAHKAPAEKTLPSHEEMVRREHKAQLAAKGKKDVGRWPVLVGVAAGIWAPVLHHQLLVIDPWAVRLLFPLMELVGREELGLSEELRRTLPQLMLFLQFPLEGWLTRLTLRQASVGRAVGQLIFLHLVGALILWMVAGAAL